MIDLKSKIRSIPDFPQKGVIFRDITTLLKDAEGLQEAIAQMHQKIMDLDYDVIIGAESRGFLFGMPIAYNEEKSFVPVRKKGKLPAKTISKEYALEDALQKGQKVVIVDDLLATGGTAKAIIEMVEEVGAEVVALDFLIELEGLKGREVLKGYRVESVLKY